MWKPLRSACVAASTMLILGCAYFPIGTPKHRVIVSGFVVAVSHGQPIDRSMVQAGDRRAQPDESGFFRLEVLWGSADELVLFVDGSPIERQSFKSNCGLVNVINDQRYTCYQRRDFHVTEAPIRRNGDESVPCVIVGRVFNVSTPGAGISSRVMFAPDSTWSDAGAVRTERNGEFRIEKPSLGSDTIRLVDPGASTHEKVLDFACTRRQKEVRVDFPVWESEIS